MAVKTWYYHNMMYYETMSIIIRILYDTRNNTTPTGVAQQIKKQVEILTKIQEKLVRLFFAALQFNIKQVGVHVAARALL